LKPYNKLEQINNMTLNVPLDWDGLIL